MGVIQKYDYQDQSKRPAGSVVIRDEMPGVRQFRDDSEPQHSTLNPGDRPVRADFPLYRLPELLSIKDKQQSFIFVDDEASADFLIQNVKVPATTRFYTPGSTLDPQIFAVLARKTLVLIPRNTKASREFMDHVAAVANTIVSEVKIVEVPNLPPDEPITVWFEAGNNRDDLVTLIKATSPWVPVNLIFQPLTLGFIQNSPGKEMLIEGLIGRRDLGMVFGIPNVGKSFLVLDLLASLSLGQAWADGQFTVPTPMQTMYLVEEGVAALPTRLKSLAAHRQVGLADLMEHITIIPRVPQLFLQESATTSELSADRFIEDIRLAHLKHPDLIVIDTMSDATTGADENSARDARIVMQQAKHLCEAFNAAVLFVHHANRTMTGERGSGAFRAKMDVILEVSDPKADPNKPYTPSGIGVLACSKMRDGRPFTPLGFSLSPVNQSVAITWTGVHSPASKPRNPSTTRQKQP